MSYIKTKTGENTITFDAFYQYIWARNYGNTDVYISTHNNIVAGDDDVALLPAGEAVRLTVNGKTLYVLGSTTLEVHAQNFSDSPFAWNEADGGSGSDVSVVSLSVNDNGTYTAPSGTAYSPVVVNVSDIPSVIEPLSITQNGTYTAPVGVDGYSPVTVNVPAGFTVGNDIDFKNAVFVLSPTDKLDISGNTYSFKFALYDENSGVSYPLSKYVTATGSMKMWYRVYVYNQDALVATVNIGNYINMYSNYKVYAVSVELSNGVITLNAMTLDNWGNEIPCSGQASLSSYIDTTETTPVYSISNAE